MRLLNSFLGRKTKERGTTLPLPSSDSVGIMEQYVVSELAKAVSADWKVTASETDRLSWRIEKLVTGTDQGDLVDFGLFVTGDLKWFVFTFGNNDIGCDVWRQSVLKARVFQTAFLNLPEEIQSERTPGWQVDLSKCVRELMDGHPPNEWGYT